MNENKTELEFMQSAEFRKTWSIGYFNSLNFACEMVRNGSFTNDEEAKTKLIFWRDWAISEHAKYYKDNIAPAGMQAFTPMVEAGLAKAKKLYESTQSTSGK